MRTSNRRRLPLAALGAIAVLAGLWFVRAIAFDRSLPAAPALVIVPRGATAGEVAQTLSDARVIASPWEFRLLARARGVESRMKAGQYRFAPHRTLDEVLRQLVEGGNQVAVWVTLPEGLTAREIASELERRGVGEASAFEEYFLGTPFTIDGATSSSLEGFLFPDTYLVPVDATPEVLAKILTDRFREELPRDAAIRAKRLHLNVVQIVTLASLIEREAQADDERALMAGVYYNRLRRGMPLEVDATIEYTFAHHKDVITLADLARDSPYNTYLNLGLPPTPIANPGRPSLWAALHPLASDYLYYVYKGNGHHAFSRTLSEHNANVAKYLR